MIWYEDETTFYMPKEFGLYEPPAAINEHIETGTLARRRAVRKPVPSTLKPMKAPTIPISGLLIGGLLLVGAIIAVHLLKED